jgi:putative transposase
VERFNHRIHCFCFMDNHIHLIIQVGEKPLSRIIQNLSFRYTRYINVGQERTGHLFQGRYKAILIDADSYLLELVRYIHNNPVRSGIAQQCGEYRWSSHRAYCGEGVIPWLTTDWVLDQFSDQADIARQLYIEFVQQGIAEEHRPEFHRGSFQGRALGDEQFIEQALAQAEEKYQTPYSLDQIIEAVCTVYEITPSMLIEPGRRRTEAEARAMAARLVLEIDNLTLTELAVSFQRGLSGLSQAAGRLQKRMRKDLELVYRLEEVKKLL